MMALSVDDIERLMVAMVTHRVDLVKVGDVVVQKSSHTPAPRAAKTAVAPLGEGAVSARADDDEDEDEDEELLFASAGS